MLQLVKFSRDILSVALVTPFLDVFVSQQFFLFVVKRLFLFDELILYLIAGFQDFSERLVLHKMILHPTPQELLEQLSLLSDEVARLCDHLTEPRVHLMLLLAPRHPIQLTELLHKFMHREHCRG